MQPDVSLRPIDVLVVDDNPDHRFLIERRLGDEGIMVRAAGSGEEALAMLDGIDIVLLDFRLGGNMDGLETLEAIQSQDGSSGPSVVMVTGMGSEDIAVQAMRAGAIDYVMKDHSYLAMLPEVVQRAYRHHDLARRAGQLQRLALLVSAADDRETVFNEVVTGAQQLLPASTAVLFVNQNEGLEIGALTGELTQDLGDLQLQATKVLGRGVEDPFSDGDRLLVCLHKRDEEPIGVLALLSDTPTEHSAENVELAQAFASFTGVAVRNFLRLELERELIQQLQQTMEARRDFVSSISHELRTPLACITGFTNTLTDRWDELDEATIKDCIERIQKHSMDLAYLVQQILDFRTSESARFTADVRPVDLEDELDGVIASLKPVIGDRSIVKDLAPLKVLADPELLRRTFINLMENALKYSEPNQPVTITARGSGPLARIEIADRGTGLTEAEVEAVFAPFWRGKQAMTSAARGVGIGLTLVHEYVRMMGGDVGVDSEPGAGSTFYFTLPLAQEIPSEI
jgi:signal transduction histidine kinase